MLSHHAVHPLSGMTCALLAAVVAAFPLFSSYAQEEGEPAPEPEPEETREEPVQPERTLTGDIITFKSGTVWGNVQILNSTPKHYEVEQIPGVPPVLIDRRLVDHVQMDDRDPLKERRMQALMPRPSERSEVSAEQLSPEFREKLTAPLSQDPIVFTDTSVGAILRELASKAGVPVEIDQSVRDLRPQEKLWTLNLAPGTTLLGVLQDEMGKAFPNLRVDFDIDKMTILTAAQAEAREATAAPPADSQP